MARDLRLLNKAALQELCNKYGIEDKVEVSEGSKVATNKDYIKAIIAYEELNPAPKEVTDEDRYEFNNALVPCIITDHDNLVNIEDDDETRQYQFSYNTGRGVKSCFISLSGREQYVPRVALYALANIPNPTFTQDSKNKPKTHLKKKRFSITETSGWTPEQFEAQRATQLARLKDQDD